MATTAILAQDAVRPLSFDVVSIKPSRQTRATGSPLLGGRLVMTGRTLQDLILPSYLVHTSQIIGIQPWMLSVRYDITAVIEHPPANTNDVRMRLLRSLLADRFGLRLHAETREREALSLRPTRPGQPLPAGLQPSQSRCGGITVEEHRANTREGWPPCGALAITNVPDPEGRGETTHQRWSALTLDEFIATLISAIGEPVVNETGLDGRYDIEFEFVRALPGGSPGNLPEGPTLPAALEEQLGLRLERRRVPVPVLVIDAAAPPATD